MGEWNVFCFVILVVVRKLEIDWCVGCGVGYVGGSVGVSIRRCDDFDFIVIVGKSGVVKLDDLLDGDVVYIFLLLFGILVI